MTHEEKKQDIRNQLSNLDAYTSQLETAKAKLAGVVTATQSTQRQETYDTSAKKYLEAHNQDTAELNGHIATAGAALDNLQAVIQHALDTIANMRTQTLEEARRPPVTPPPIGITPVTPTEIPPVKAPLPPPPGVPRRVWERFGLRIPSLDEKTAQLEIDVKGIDVFVDSIEGLKKSIANLVDVVQSNASELHRAADPKSYANALESAGYTMGANLDIWDISIPGLIEQLELVADMYQEMARQLMQPLPPTKTLR